MTISNELRYVDLILECKYCGHPTIKKGGWFMVVIKVKCEACQREVPLTYKDKIAFFDKQKRHAQTRSALV
jgi:hypothetical protein